MLILTLKMYWGDIGYKHYIIFMCASVECDIHVLYCELTSQSLVSFHDNCLTPFTLRALFPPSFPTGNQHSVVCISEFVFVCFVGSFVTFYFMLYR